MKLKIFWQYLLPQHLLSVVLGSLAKCRLRSLKNFLIKIFCSYYKVDLSEAEKSDYREYENFQQFFVRCLKAGARPLATDVHAILSPVDGKVSQIGQIVSGQLLQAKKFTFSLVSLLGGHADLAAFWQDGHFATLYLAPHNYHRVHIPFTGQLKEMIYVPGKLFSVNNNTVQAVPALFARNERVICVFDTALGSMAVILVGALIVGSISTVWSGIVTPPHGKTIFSKSYADQNIILERGTELGAFNLGSTVILLFPKDKIVWNEDCLAGTAVKMGQLLGKVM